MDQLVEMDTCGANQSSKVAVLLLCVLHLPPPVVRKGRHVVSLFNARLAVSPVNNGLVICLLIQGYWYRLLKLMLSSPPPTPPYCARQSLRRSFLVQDYHCCTSEAKNTPVSVRTADLCYGGITRDQRRCVRTSLVLITSMQRTSSSSGSKFPLRSTEDDLAAQLDILHPNKQANLAGGEKMTNVFQDVRDEHIHVLVKIPHCECKSLSETNLSSSLQQMPSHQIPLGFLLPRNLK